jgi:hypothetical protein
MGPEQGPAEGRIEDPSKAEHIAYSEKSPREAGMFYKKVAETLRGLVAETDSQAIKAELSKDVQRWEQLATDAEKITNATEEAAEQTYDNMQ